MKKSKLVVIVLFILLLIVAGIGFLQRDKIEASLKKSRSESLLKKAETALNDGENDKARDLAISAYYLSPNNVESLRLLLKSGTTTSNNSQIYRVANAIFYHPNATAQDRANALDVFLPTKNRRHLRQLFDTIPKDNLSDPEIMYRQARFLAGHGSPAGALNVLNKGPKDDPRFKFFRTAIQSLATNEEMRKTGQNELAALMSSEDQPTANKAFNFLRTLPLSLRETQILRPAAEKWINNQPEKRAVDQIVLNTFDWIEAGGLKQTPASNKVAIQTSDELGKENPVLIGNWLNGIGQFPEANKIAANAAKDLDPSNNQSRLKQFLLYQIQLRALESTQKWEEMKTLLDAPPKNFPALQLASLRAVTAKRMGDKTEALKNWQEAWRVAELNAPLRNSYLTLYQTATKAGETDLAVRSMMAASKHELGILPDADQLTLFMIYLAENDKHEQLIDFTKNVLNRKESYGAPIINNIVYLRELVDDPVENRELFLDRLLQKYPKVTGIETTKILVLINLKKYTEAHALAEKILEGNDINKLPAAEAVLIAGAYKFAGKELTSNEEFNLDEKLEGLLKIEKKVLPNWFKDSAKP